LEAVVHEVSLCHSNFIHIQIVEMNTRKIIFILIFAFGAQSLAFVFADTSSDDTEKFNPINTAAPSLSIAPDARAGGMGDVGVATSPDVYSQYWNPAKYAFATSKSGISISYTPWLQKLVNDIYLANVTGYYKFGTDNNQALSASLRYFSIGDVPIYEDGEETSSYSIAPYEMALDIAYSRKLTQSFSMGVAFRYIRSDYSYLGSDGDAIVPGNTIAADISGYNESYVMLGQTEALLGLGFNVSNIGNKISTDGGDNYSYIPTNLRLGASLTYPMDDYNTIAFSADINKLLVPTPPVQGDDEDDDDYELRVYAYNNQNSAISGIFKSFSDAPGGLKEELQEVMWSAGVEYNYNKQFTLRGGYFNENQNKGNRKYFTFGAGFKLNVFQLDASYLVSTAQTNPLDQTLRFSISFDMDGLKSLFGRGR